MMPESDRYELLELYKLHAGLADRVSQRREGANRLFVSLLTGLMVLLAALLRLETANLGTNSVIGLASAGLLLSVAWLVHIQSYRQLNTGKFKALLKLEKKLPFQFFECERRILDRSGYRSLTRVETLIPIIFFILFLVVMCAAN